MEKFPCALKNNYLVVFMILLSVLSFYKLGKCVGEFFYYILN